MHHHQGWHYCTIMYSVGVKQIQKLQKEEAALYLQVKMHESKLILSPVWGYAKPSGVSIKANPNHIQGEVLGYQFHSLRNGDKNIAKRKIARLTTRASNRIFFHFPVSEGYNRVDNRIANIVKIIV